MSRILIGLVRETLSEDLIERLIMDILEVTESLTSKSQLSTTYESILTCEGDPGDLMAVVGTAKAKSVHHPDEERGRPDKDNFHGDNEASEQVGYSKQC